MKSATAIVDRAAIDRFYAAAAVGLSALDAATGRARRFGPEADARWRGFRGELVDADRLDLLVREAATAHPAAFAPRSVFSLPGLADDEPFGPDWPGADAAKAAGWLRVEPVREIGDALDAAARALEVPVAPVGDPLLEQLTATTRLLVAGASAIVALGRRFSGRRELDLADQVACVAATPSERQLFGLACALTGSRRQARLYGVPFSLQELRAGMTRLDGAIASNDCAAPVREAVTAAAAAWGA